LHYIDGKLISKDYELFDTPIEDDPDAVSGIIRQFYQIRGVLPKTILLPVITSDTLLLEQFFTEIAGHRVNISTPQRGEKVKLVQSANINAREEAERASTVEEKTLKTLEWLHSALKLDTSPERIEAYDISNTGASDIVAAMAVFVRGKPLKKDFRRFRIKRVQEQDDYRSMTEVVSRRVARYNDNDEKFGQLPNLILIDGGAAHASVVRSVLSVAEIDIPVYGMVKDNKHKTRALISPDGEEIGLSANPAVFALIGTIQEQTHKYALDYHRNLRSRNSYKSRLDSIEGVGEKRRNALLKRFGSIKAISAATVEELSTTVPKSVAEKIFEHFHADSGEDA
jgi:excinuclease ABC subunit C